MSRNLPRETANTQSMIWELERSLTHITDKGERKTVAAMIAREDQRLMELREQITGGQ